MKKREKENKIKILIMWGIAALMFVVTLIIYPKLPAQMATHWNGNFKVDGFEPRFWGAFIIPFMTVGIIPLMLILPKIDPLRRNDADYYRNFLDFMVAFAGFLFIVQLFVLLYNIGIKFNMNALVSVLIGFLYYFIGVILTRVKQNWFMGIRTPWTLSSKTVWEKTNRLGSVLFKICAVISMFGAIFNKYSALFVGVPVLIAGVYLVIYSYMEYQKEIAKEK